MGLNLGKLDNANKIDFIHVINRSATYTHLEDSREGTDGGLHFINASIVRLIQMFECLDHILELLDAIVQHLLLLQELSDKHVDIVGGAFALFARLRFAHQAIELLWSHEASVEGGGGSSSGLI